MTKFVIWEESHKKDCATCDSCKKKVYLTLTRDSDDYPVKLVVVDKDGKKKISGNIIAIGENGKLKRFESIGCMESSTHGFKLTSDGRIKTIKES